MATALTVSEADCLDFIETFMRAETVAPSVDEIRGGLGYTSKSPVFRMLERMQDKGAIVRRYNRNRSIEVLTPALPHQTEYEARLEMVRALHAPCPSFAGQTLSNIRLPRMEPDSASGVKRPQSPSLAGVSIQGAHP